MPTGRSAALPRWLADWPAPGAPRVLDAQAASAYACLAALDEGLDISGTFFRFGGEPYTEAKAEVVAATGSTAACHY